MAPDIPGKGGRRRVGAGRGRAGAPERRLAVWPGCSVADPHPPALHTTQGCPGAAGGCGGRASHQAPTPSQLPREPRLCCAGCGSLDTLAGCHLLML